MPVWTAIAAPGLEPVVHRELEALGLNAQPHPGHVRFEAPAARAPELVRRLRSPSRLLLELGSGPAHTLEELAARIRQAPWKDVLNAAAPIEVNVLARSSRLSRKDIIARKAQHSLADVQRGLRRHSAPHRGRPLEPQGVQLRVDRDTLTIAMDAGGLLYKRGWRGPSGKAPLRENLAASLLLMAGYTGDEPLVDPFCGSGTIPIEAALLAQGRSPHTRKRAFACDAWPGAKASPREPRPSSLDHAILGADREPRAVTAATENAASAEVSVDWRHLDVRELEPPPGPPGLVITNPPYGHRLGQNVEGVYAIFGRTLRERFEGWRLLFLSPSPELAQKVDRRAQRLTLFPNGSLRVGAYVIESI